MDKRLVPVVAALLLAIVPSPSAAQSTNDDDWAAIRWWHPLAASAGVATLMLVDEPMAEWIQGRRSEGTDDFGDAMVHFSEDATIYWTAGGLVAAGLIARKEPIARTGVQVITVFGISGLLVRGGKWMFGRGRPSADIDDAWSYDLFDGTDGSAFPSGAAMQAFGLATTLADAIDHPVASWTLYSAASLNAWARLNANRHWVSDVALGGIVGMTVARLVNGKWRVFGLRPPSLWAGPSQMGLTWTTPF